MTLKLRISKFIARRDLILQDYGCRVLRTVQTLHHWCGWDRVGHIPQGQCSGAQASHLCSTLMTCQFASKKGGPEISLKPLHSVKILPTKWHACQCYSCSSAHSFSSVTLSWSPTCISLKLLRGIGSSGQELPSPLKSFSDLALSQIAGEIKWVAFRGSFLEKKQLSYTVLFCIAW